MKELNVVLIDRKGADRSDPLKPLKEALAAGDSLIIFPEGTVVRSRCRVNLKAACGV